MRILLDECIDESLRRHFQGHQCQTCRYAGFKGLANGDLIAAADEAGFQALVTVDRNMIHQQSLENRAISIIVLLGRSTNIDDLLALMPEVLSALEALSPGSVVSVGRSQAAQTRHFATLEFTLTMSSLSITLPDGSQESVAPGTRPIDIAKSISPRLANDAIVARVNGELFDLTRPLESDARVEILTPKNPEALGVYRHSTAHLLAAAVLELFPETKLGIGPPTEAGFYYDFQRAEKFTLEDLEKIEARMHELQAKNLPFERKLTPKAEGLAKYQDDWMKRELIEERAGEIFSEYTLGPHFIDFCRGPHVPSTEKLKAFKLLSIAGAYWKGNEKNPQLQRIYGTAFFTKKELEEYLNRLEEAKKRDHRRIGRELELFTVNELVGAGLPLWLPKGATVRRVLEEYILEKERQTGYQHVYTPDLAKVDLYQRSGHWEHYHEDMFPPMDLETEQMVLRPMNCPHHILIYQSKMRSYRDLPVRIAELGTMYRYERSGVLSGLSRVRCMTLNDAHIFCTPDQIKSEFTRVMQLVEAAYKDLGITQYTYRLSLRDKANTEKYVANDEMWGLAERVLREAMDSLGLAYVEAPGEAAFYGPKLDIQLADVMGHEETYSTIQIDFHLPNQFELAYIGADGHEHRPVMIHRAIVSTMERMISYLIELYAGAFPLWLAPVQAIVLPISDRQNDYARQVHRRLVDAGLRAEIDDRSDKVNFKIREAQLHKIPYMLVVGDREAQAGQVSVRNRKHGDQGVAGLDEIISRLTKLDTTRSVQE